MTAPIVESRRPSVARVVGFLLLLAGVSWGLGSFASYPMNLAGVEGGLLTIAVKHVAAFEHEERKLSPEELEKLPRHMRPLDQRRSRTGKRVESLLRVTLDGQRVLEKRYQPSGFRKNGPTLIHEELPLSTGTHRLEVLLSDASGEAEEEGEEPRRQWQLSQALELGPRQVILIDFSEEAGLTVR